MKRTRPDFRVLPNLSAKQRIGILADLQKQHPTMPIDGKSVPWNQLGAAWDPSGEMGTARMDKDRMHRESPENTLIRYVPGGLNIWDPAQNAATWEKYKEDTQKSVTQRGSEALSDAFESFKKVADAALGNKEIEASARYYLRFAPSAGAISGDDPEWSAFLFDRLNDVISHIRSLLGYLWNGSFFAAEKLWEVLRDPDAAYIRLRGEVAELGRTQPDFPFLEWVAFIPDLFRLLVRLIFDDRVAPRTKRALLMALLYLISPIDAFPEAAVGPQGYIDDVFIVVIAIADLVDESSLSPGLLEEHWAGSRENLERLKDGAAKLPKISKFFSVLEDWWKAHSKEEKKKGAKK